MPHCQCSMMVHLSPEAIDTINSSNTPLGEVLKTYEDIFMGEPGSAIRESVAELLDRNLFFAADMDKPHSQVQADLGVELVKFAAEYENRRQEYKIYWARPKTNVADHMATESGDFPDGPHPTCARWGWVNGQLVCDYNYGIALVPTGESAGSTALEKLNAMTEGKGAYHIDLKLNGPHVNDVWSP